MQLHLYVIIVLLYIFFFSWQYSFSCLSEYLWFSLFIFFLLLCPTHSLALPLPLRVLILKIPHSMTLLAINSYFYSFLHLFPSYEFLFSPVKTTQLYRRILWILKHSNQLFTFKRSILLPSLGISYFFKVWLVAAIFSLLRVLTYFPPLGPNISSQWCN